MKIGIPTDSGALPATHRDFQHRRLLYVLASRCSQQVGCAANNQASRELRLDSRLARRTEICLFAIRSAVRRDRREETL